MKMKTTKLFKMFALAIATSLMALALTACGGGKGDLKTAKEPLTASEAFNQEGVWFFVGKDGIISKDQNIRRIFVFDGEGNVTSYQTTNLTLSDLKELSDDEIIALAKEQDKKIFDDEKKEKINIIQEEIDHYQSSYDYLKQDLDSKRYESARSTMRFTMVTDKQISSDPEVIAEIEEWYNEELTEYESIIKKLKSKKDITDKLEYKEPIAQSVALNVKTDNSGNHTESEELTYTYDYVRWGDRYEVSETPEYAESKKSITLFSDYGLGTVYDMNFRGFGSIITLVNEEHAGFTFDSPDTKGIDVD